MFTKNQMADVTKVWVPTSSSSRFRVYVPGLVKRGHILEFYRGKSEQGNGHRFCVCAVCAPHVSSSQEEYMNKPQ